MLCFVILCNVCNKVLQHYQKKIKKILSIESSKQKLTFLLDRQFFASLRSDLVFMFCPKNQYDFAFAQPALSFF